jgi:superfamily II DNA or RNA helicase
MKLRRWQSQCVEQALAKFRNGENHFLCLATPGAGKTCMTATLAQRLLQLDMIDLVLCFSPSIIVSSDFQQTLETHTRCRMDGRLGSKGQSLTYQSMLSLEDAFWVLFETHRVLVIFDEIHHCAGDNLENANAWGQSIIQHIQGRATYTIALTGTPWRSDRIPIALSSYCQHNKIRCDFIYGMAQAIRENVCRAPSITMVDNDRIIVKCGDTTEKYSSFAELLRLSDCSYQQLIDNDALIVYLLKQSSKKLMQIRKQHQNAGGLIVAASVDHAYKIATLLERHLGQRACVATYLDEDAHGTINSFRISTQPWIVSVGMVSEGTNIPRLRVKTELHFRQVLGRVLRMGDIPGESYLYLPAEPNLVEFANRIAEEIPESASIRRETMTSGDDENLIAIKLQEPQKIEEITEIIFENSLGIESQPNTYDPQLVNTSTLAQSYDSTINVFGRFRQELLQLHRLYARKSSSPL